MRSGQFSPSESNGARPHAPRRFVSVAQDLLDRIERRELSPGDRLPPDRVLATNSAVSRATIREALLALELLGIVEIRHGSGVYVRESSASSNVDYEHFRPSTAALFEARAAVEPKIAELCALRMTPEAIRQMSATMTAARAAIRGKAAYQEFAALQLDFHASLAANCASPVLSEIARGLISVDEHPLWALINQHAVRTQAQRMQQVAEHAAVLKAIKAGDAPAAAEAMRRHLGDLGTTLLGAPWTP